VDVTELGVDLLAFTGHKMLGRLGAGSSGAAGSCWRRCPRS